MQKITSGRMTIIPTLEGDGYALPGGAKCTSRNDASCIATLLLVYMGQEPTTEQRAHYIKNGGMGYAKHDA